MCFDRLSRRVNYFLNWIGMLGLILVADGQTSTTRKELAQEGVIV